MSTQHKSRVLRDPAHPPLYLSKRARTNWIRNAEKELKNYRYKQPLIHRFIFLIIVIKYFTIDTESDCDTYDIALIQIHSIPVELPAIVVLIELNHLPSIDSLLFSQTWSLQDSLIYTCGQFLDKAPTKNYWSLLLDPLYSTISSSTLSIMIRYATYDCLAVSYLHRPVLENWCLQELKQSRICLLLTHLSSIMLDELEDISDDDIHLNRLEDISDDEIHLSQLKDISTDAIPFNQLEPKFILRDTNQTTGEFLTHTNSSLKHRTRTHAYRSFHDRMKRNKKRNVIRRYFRYKYYIRRVLYHRFNMFMIKQILRRRNVHFVHIKRKDAELIIGVKNASLRDEYQHRLPLDMFTRHQFICSYNKRVFR
ncbi:unnamed protein product [Rotaria magnacalcarata]|uniref:Uncharacterized protein n=1 Tax=Rotaria magnacalcarata TaxID=392030 RepID=A0A816QB95_9BILA|nr:unnamed protein product [Rotaria magnacalcarata]